MSTITQEQIVEALKRVKDPELDMDIHSLGLIYNVAVGEDGVDILMTLTTPFCPYGNEIIESVEKEVGKLGQEVRVDITFEPEWQPTEELRLVLGI